MTRVPVAILAIALMTSVPGMAFAAQDAAAPDAQSVGAAPVSTTPAQRQAADRDVAGEAYTAALNLLEAAGYDNFSNLRQEGNIFEVTVIDHGQPHQMTVDPASGQIQPHA